MTVAGGLGAAERQMHFRADGRGVDVEYAGVHLVHRFERAIDVLRVDGSRQSIAHAVRDLNRFFERVGGNDGCYWSKDFFLRAAHVRRRVGEGVWLDEESFCVIAARETFAATGECCAVVVTPDTDVIHDLLDGVVINHWTNVSLRIGAVADAP